METKAESAIEAQPQNSRKLIDRYFKSRPDIGIGNLLLDVALEARDPFKSWEPRNGRRDLWRRCWSYCWPSPGSFIGTF